MDLLFTRYASPFVLLDNLIATASLSTFIDDFFKFIGEEKQEETKWQFFLHKVFDKSWKEFCEEIDSANKTEKIDLGATIKKSYDMLNNFTPEGEV